MARSCARLTVSASHHEPCRGPPAFLDHTIERPPWSSGPHRPPYFRSPPRASSSIIVWGLCRSSPYCKSVSRAAVFSLHPAPFRSDLGQTAPRGRARQPALLGPAATPVEPRQLGRRTRCRSLSGSATGQVGISGLRSAQQSPGPTPFGLVENLVDAGAQPDADFESSEPTPRQVGAVPVNPERRLGYRVRRRPSCRRMNVAA